MIKNKNKERFKKKHSPYGFLMIVLRGAPASPANIFNVVEAPASSVVTFPAGIWK
jgi:hypothetical protein